MLDSRPAGKYADSRKTGYLSFKGDGKGCVGNMRGEPKNGARKKGEPEHQGAERRRFLGLELWQQIAAGLAVAAVVATVGIVEHPLVSSLKYLVAKPGRGESSTPQSTTARPSTSAVSGSSGLSDLYWRGLVNLSQSGDYGVAFDHNPPYFNKAGQLDDIYVNGGGPSDPFLVGPHVGTVAILRSGRVASANDCANGIATAGTSPEIYRSDIQVGDSICLWTQAKRLAVLYIRALSSDTASSVARGVSIEGYVYNISPLAEGLERFSL